MFKILSIFLLLLSMLFSKGVHFSETKYYDALEKTLTKQGHITFDGHGKIRIVYEHNQSIVTYTGTFLYIEKKGKTKKVDLSQKPAIKMFFVLFEAIYLNQNNVIEAYFEKKVFEGVMLLTPKGKTRQYISKVRYKRVKNRLKFLEIYLTNKDWVRIETGD